MTSYLAYLGNKLSLEKQVSMPTRQLSALLSELLLPSGALVATVSRPSDHAWAGRHGDGDAAEIESQPAWSRDGAA